MVDWNMVWSITGTQISTARPNKSPPWTYLLMKVSPEKISILSFSLSTLWMSKSGLCWGTKSFSWQLLQNSSCGTLNELEQWWYSTESLLLFFFFYCTLKGLSDQHHFDMNKASRHFFPSTETCHKSCTALVFKLILQVTSSAQRNTVLQQTGQLFPSKTVTTVFDYFHPSLSPFSADVNFEFNRPELIIFEWLA